MKSLHEICRLKIAIHSQAKLGGCVNKGTVTLTAIARSDQTQIHSFYQPWRPHPVLAFCYHNSRNVYALIYTCVTPLRNLRFSIAVEKKNYVPYDLAVADYTFLLCNLYTIATSFALHVQLFGLALLTMIADTRKVEVLQVSPTQKTHSYTEECDP